MTGVWWWVIPAPLMLCRSFLSRSQKTRQMLLKYNHHTKQEKTWKTLIATDHVLPRRRRVRGIKPLGDDQLSLNIYYHHPLVIHDSIHLVSDREYQQNLHYKLETT